MIYHYVVMLQILMIAVRGYKKNDRVILRYAGCEGECEEDPDHEHRLMCAPVVRIKNLKGINSDQGWKKRDQIGLRCGLKGKIYRKGCMKNLHVVFEDLKEIFGVEILFCVPKNGKGLIKKLVPRSDEFGKMFVSSEEQRVNDMGEQNSRDWEAKQEAAKAERLAKNRAAVPDVKEWAKQKARELEDRKNLRRSFIGTTRDKLSHVQQQDLENRTKHDDDNQLKDDSHQSMCSGDSARSGYSLGSDFPETACSYGGALAGIFSPRSTKEWQDFMHYMSTKGYIQIQNIFTKITREELNDGECDLNDREQLSKAEEASMLAKWRSTRDESDRESQNTVDSLDSKPSVRASASDSSSPPSRPKPVRLRSGSIDVGAASDRRRRLVERPIHRLAKLIASLD